MLFAGYIYIMLCDFYRYLWDGKMTGCKLITKIDKQTEVFQYISPSIPPLTERDHCLLR